ncbi:HAD family hydrolase [Mycolicibacterium sp. Dal123E01]|uniref:HAD family hydrolase n=1 Tax=Mycolicibacterium sp. Dal123E01 TaxID=3457578 RepID=UPI00403EC50F
MPPSAVLFDFSGTLFRLEEDDSWFAGMELIDDDGRRAVDEHAQGELMERLTHPTGGSVTRTEEAQRAWLHRDLVPALHREAYLHALRDAGLPDDHAESLYRQAIDPASWAPYPDTVEVLRSLTADGVRTAIVSNIAFDIRPAFRAAGADADEFVLSFEVGVVKPDPRIFQIALERLGVAADETVMVGDSEENDGAARALGCGFVLVDPLPVADRPTGLLDGLRDRGIGR